MIWLLRLILIGAALFALYLIVTHLGVSGIGCGGAC